MIQRVQERIYEKRVVNNDNTIIGRYVKLETDFDKVFVFVLPLLSL